MTYTLQVHTDHGADEDFEADSPAEANEMLRGFRRDPNVRLVVILDENERVVAEYLR